MVTHLHDDAANDRRVGRCCCSDILAEAFAQAFLYCGHLTSRKVDRRRHFGVGDAFHVVRQPVERVRDLHFATNSFARFTANT